MKRILLMLVMCICIVSFPNQVKAGNPGIYSTDVVTDEADLLTDDEEADLRERIEEIEDKYNFTIAIVTTDSLYGKSNAEKFTDDYYDYNNFSSDGACLMRCPTTRDLYISTSGDGIEYLNDDDIDDILDEMVPQVKRGDFYDACCTFLDEVEYNIENHGDEERGSILTIILGASVVSLIVTIVTIMALKSGMNTAKIQTRGDQYIKTGTFEITSARDIYLYSRVSVRPKVENTSGGRSSTHRGSSGRSHGGGGRKC